MGNLRPYQDDLIQKLFEAYSEGYKAPCLVLPCGGGKSVIVAEIARLFTGKGCRVLFLVHRKELCEQIYNTFSFWGVNMDLCSIQMVQTVSRHLSQTPKPALIITDENHHSLAKTYKKIYKYFDKAFRVGVTATPERINGQGLADVNDKLILGVTAKWLIENHFLAPYDYYAPDVKVPKFHIRNGDFDSGEVNNWFEQNQKKIYGDVIKNYRRIADGKQGICYLPSVSISENTAEMFIENGITAAHIDGSTPKDKRTQIINDFRDGKIKILCNVDIISEGFDVPDCECVILLRPTKSLILYTQQSMRCMRYKPNKKAIIIDHVNNVAEFGFPDTEREWLLEGHPKKKKQGEAPVKTCPICFRMVATTVRVCPHCGFKFKMSESRKTVEVDMDLKRISDENTKSKVRHYISPNECKNVDELRIYAKLHNYKPGWVYFQQKNRGWLNGERNKNTKRYPCRAVKGWDSQTE